MSNEVAIMNKTDTWGVTKKSMKNLQNVIKDPIKNMYIWKTYKSPNPMCDMIRRFHILKNQIFSLLNYMKESICSINPIASILALLLT